MSKISVKNKRMTKLATPVYFC